MEKIKEIELAKAKARWVLLLHSEKGQDLVLAHSLCKMPERENILKQIEELVDELSNE